jgi:hypothetical protein
MPLSPTTKHAVVVGQLIALPPGEFATAVQLTPPSFEPSTEYCPTAKQTVVVGQLTLFMSLPALIVWLLQVAPPSAVFIAAPWYPTPTQVVTLAQLNEKSPFD